MKSDSAKPKAVESGLSGDGLSAKNGDKSVAGEPKLQEDRSPPPTLPTRYVTNIFPGKNSFIPNKFAVAVQQLEESIKMPIWLFMQDTTDEGDFNTIDVNVIEKFLRAREKLPDKTPIALLIHSPGGLAKCAFQLAMLFRHRCGGFHALVPKYAKSAATLLALGADSIILGEYAELGPLDAQFFDTDREVPGSALDEVQALERLHAFALEAADRSMMLMLGRTGKNIDSLLPTMLHFVSDMMRPLFEKIDAVHYTQRSRALKVAEEYAIRLLEPRYGRDEAQRIARHLVEKYPEHGFIIDAAEAASFGLETEKFSGEQNRIIDAMWPYLGKLTAIGRLEEVEGS